MSKDLGSYLYRRVLVMSQDSCVWEVARAMTEQNYGSALIANLAGHFVGIVTDRDLVCEIMAERLGLETPVLKAVTSNLVCASPESSLDQVIRLMEQNAVRRIPIVHQDPTGRENCLGIVSLDDLIADELISLEQLAKIVRPQRVRPKYRMSSQRSVGQREHTLSRFYKTLAENMDLSKERAEPIINFILQEVVQRLPYTLAENFIAQLPSKLQESLYDLPAGPDRRIDDRLILNELGERFGIHYQDGFFVTRGLWLGLEAFIDYGILDKVLRALPMGMRHLFLEESTPGWPFSLTQFNA